MYYQQLITLIKDLLCQQKCYIDKTNGILFGQATKLEVEKVSLEKDQTTVMNQQHLRAVCQLNFIEYESFKAEWQHAENEYEFIDNNGIIPSVSNPHAIQMLL